MRILSFIFVMVFFLSVPAQAGEEYSILSIPEGQAVLHISATERVEVAQDLLVANLRYEVEDADPRAVQDAINTMMQKALKTAGKFDSVKTSTGQYYVHQYTTPRTKSVKWRGNQSLTLKGLVAEDILDLAGTLQDMGLVMGGLSYTLSPEKAAQTRDALMEDALAKLQARADRAAKALGKSKAALKDVHVQSEDGGGHHRPVMARAIMAMDAQAEMAAPVVAPGETTITLSVSADALLGE